MNLRAFLWDRLAYIAVYLGFGLLTTLIVQLSFWLTHASIQLAELVYIWLLGLLGLGLWLGIDYQRQADFLRRLSEVSGEEPLDQLGMFPDPTTLEQRLFAEAWGRLYARLRSELAAEQQRGQRNLSLVSQWAHHMKTPVAVIDLELQKAGKLGSPDDIQATLKSIEEEKQRLEHSLQTLLNVVRLEDFTQDFHVESVDLLELVRRLINEHKREFIIRKVYPKIEVEPPTNCSVASDAKWLRFILEQLLSNAIKYSSRPDRDGQVHFRCYHEGTDTLLEIADNGIGIAAEDLGRVFSPFYTGINGREYTQSTGMGLYLAKDACQRLGHGITLQSTRGEGTRVILRFAANRSIFAGVQASLRIK